MKTQFYRLLSVSFLSVLAAGSALAASEGSSESRYDDSMRSGDFRSPNLPEVGIYGGAAGQNGDRYKSDPSFMIDAGYSPTGPMALALQVQYSPSSLNIPFVHVNFNTTNVLLKEAVALGAPGSFLNYTFIGAKEGVTHYSGDVDSSTHAAIGPTLGFDVPLSRANRVSVGAEGTYLAVLGDDIATPDQVSVLGALKYWF